MTTIAQGLSFDAPLTTAQGRYGEVIIAQGGGMRPKRWTGSASDTATDAGIDAPTAAPEVTASATKRYYVARCDVSKPGACYNKPPVVTVTTLTAPPAANVMAVLEAYLSQASVGEVVVANGGKHYHEPPSVSLSSTHGTGAVITATLEGTPAAADSITQCEVISGPPFDDESDLEGEYRTQWAASHGVVINLSGASGSVDTSFWIYSEECDGPGGPLFDGWLHITQSLSWSRSSATGTGCQISVGFYGSGKRTLTTDPCYTQYWQSWGVSGAKVIAAGSGYTPGSAFTVTIPAWAGPTGTAGKDLVLECRTPGHSGNTSTPRYQVKSLAITNGGSGYTVAPELRFSSSSGFGAYATCAVTNGVVSSVNLVSGGGGYKTAPTVEIVSGGAEVFAVARPHLRGKYQCYYRYVDDTAEAKGGPIPSCLSPVTELDTGEGTSSIEWSVGAPTNSDGRVLSIELWRSTGNQATAIYRVSTISAAFPTYTDDLTDEELRNADRAGYAAMPVVMPNGDLNAMRFVPPPSDKAVVVRYQDRFWYGVDTSGNEPNSIYFSEVDEPESVPDINEFVLQQNARESDAVTALIPFGTQMLVMQSRHAYSLSFAKDPLLDASVTPIAYRGCLGQRCWDMHAGVCYVMDAYGIYATTGAGGIEDISAPIENVFRSELDFSYSKWSFLVIDPKTKILRAFVPFSSDMPEGAPADMPTRALCYSIDGKSWWTERYPHPLQCGVRAPAPGGTYSTVYGSVYGKFLLDSGSIDGATGSIIKATVTNKGAGYKFPPTLTVSGGGRGAKLEACLDSSGKVSGVWILSPGFDYTSPTVTVSAPDDSTCLDPVQATVTVEALAGGVVSTILPTYRYKTGNFEFASDSTSKTGGQDGPRGVAVTYMPQREKCDIAMRLYYNNSSSPRNNIAPRDRGVGFSQTTSDCASRLDMGRRMMEYGADSGVARSVFTGRTIDDLQSSDRHVAVELLGAAPSKVVLYQLDVSGVTGDKQ